MLKIINTVLLLFCTTVVLAAQMLTDWEPLNEQNLYPSQLEIRKMCSGESTEESEFCKAWEEAYKKHQNDFRKNHNNLTIQGDFDGDSQIDESSLMINKKTNEVAIFVILSSSEEIQTLFTRKLDLNDIWSSRFLFEESFQAIQASNFVEHCDQLDQRCKVNQKTWGFDCEKELNNCQNRMTTLQKLPFDLIWIYSMGELMGNTRTNEITLMPNKVQSVYYWDSQKGKFIQTLIGEKITVEKKN